MILAHTEDPNWEWLLGWYDTAWHDVVASEAFRIMAPHGFNIHEWGFEANLLFYGDWQINPKSIIELVAERRKICYDK